MGDCNQLQRNESFAGEAAFHKSIRNKINRRSQGLVMESAREVLGTVINSLTERVAKLESDLALQTKDQSQQAE